MKAWVLHNINDLRLESVDEPQLSDQEVLVSVKAAGICGSDIPRIYQTGAHRHPLIPGHEFSGVVEKVGVGAEPFWEGKRVGIFPLIPCGSCVPCIRQQYEMCRSYSYLGSRRDGGFAQYAAVPKGCLVSLPESVTFEEAAMLEPMSVAVHAMRRMLHDGFAKQSGAAADVPRYIVVCGLGTIGLLLVMFLLDAGSQADRILAVGNKESQRQAVCRMGLPEDCYCDGRTQDVVQWVMHHTQGIGADVFFECVGKNETLTQAVDSAAPAGRVLLVGNPYSDMQLEKSVYWKILRNQLTVKGTWNSSFIFVEGAGGMHAASDAGRAQDDWHYVLKRLAERRIDPSALISHRFGLEELEQGLQIMRDKTEDYMKIMAVL